MPALRLALPPRSALHRKDVKITKSDQGGWVGGSGGVQEQAQMHNTALSRPPLPPLPQHRNTQYDEVLTNSVQGWNQLYPLSLTSHPLLNLKRQTTNVF